MNKSKRQKLTSCQKKECVDKTRLLRCAETMPIKLAALSQRFEHPPPVFKTIHRPYQIAIQTASKIESKKNAHNSTKAATAEEAEAPAPIPTSRATQAKTANELESRSDTLSCIKMSTLTSFGYCNSMNDQISHKQQMLAHCWSAHSGNKSTDASFKDTRGSAVTTPAPVPAETTTKTEITTTYVPSSSFSARTETIFKELKSTPTALLNTQQKILQKVQLSHRKYKFKNSSTLFPTTLANVLRRILAPATSMSTSTSTPISKAKRKTLNDENTLFTSPKTTKKNIRNNSRIRILPRLGATSFLTLLTLVCLETVLLSTMSNCAKTFYMHWNTSNSIFRIDNTDHIIDVNKGNLAFEFDQVHIICPVYEPGTFENETEKYIIYNVSKVEYETCRITNADPRVIAICDKPQKLMFFTITFRPFTPQPGGLEFLPGNDYYFISTSSKDDLYRRIGGRCSTNNMKVVFKVCCAPEEKNKTVSVTTQIKSSSGSSSGAAGSSGGSGSIIDIDPSTTIIDNGAINMDMNAPTNINQGGGRIANNINTIGMSGVNTGLMPNINNGGGIQLKPINGVGTSINTNIDQFNRIPIQPNIVNGGSNVPHMGLGGHSGSGIMLTNGHNGINMFPPNRGGVSIGQYPNHHHVQTGIRINNVPPQHNYPTHKNNNNDEHHHYDKHPNEVVKNEELTYNSAAASVYLNSQWRKLTVIIDLPINCFMTCHLELWQRLLAVMVTLIFSLGVLNNFIMTNCLTLTAVSKR